jgi:hypothetical protein
MSSKTGNQSSSTPTNWNNLTDTQQTHLKVAKSIFGNKPFTSTEFRNALAAKNLTPILQPVGLDGVVVNGRTPFLNKLGGAKNYFTFLRRDGKSFVRDTGATQNQQATGTSASDMKVLADQVLKRNGKKRNLSHVNWNSWGDVISTVNSTVGKPVLTIQSKPNKYRLTNQASAQIP